MARDNNNQDKLTIRRNTCHYLNRDNIGYYRGLILQQDLPLIVDYNNIHQ